MDCRRHASHDESDRSNLVNAARTILTTTQPLNAPNPLSLLFTRLYRDATRFHKGKHVKDLKNLNRDLRKVNLSWIG